MNAIQEVAATVWQNTVFHWLILFLLTFATITEIILVLKYYESTKKTSYIISNLEKDLKKQRKQTQGMPINSSISFNNSSWLREHFSGTVSGKFFRVKLEEERLILLKYPTALFRSIPRSPLRFLPGILIAIGVLGTFYGIQAGLATMPLDTISQDTSSLLAASGQLLQGMNTAFSTSLMGLAASSLLTVILAIGEWGRRYPISKLRKRLDKITILETPGRILSRLNLDANAQAAETLSNVAKSIQELVESQQNLTSEAIGREVGKVMSPVFIEIRDELTALREIKADQGQELIRQLLEEQREQLIKPIIQELSHSAQLTQDASVAVRELRDELGEVTQSLSQSVVTIQEFQRDTLSRLQEFATGLQETFNQFRTETQGVMERVSTEIQTAVSSSVQAMESQRNAFSESANQAANTFRGIREDLQTALQTQAETERQMMQEFQERTVAIIQTQTDTITIAGQEASQLMNVARENLTATLSNIDTMLQQTRITVQEELEEFRLNYQASLQGFFNNQNQLLEETLGEQRKGLAEVVDNLKQGFEEEYQRRQTLHKNMELSLKHTVATVKTVGGFAKAIGLTSGERLEQIQEITRTVGHEAQRVEKVYESLIVHLNQGLEDSNKHLVSYLERASASEQHFFTQADEATTKISNQLLHAANYLVAAESNRRHTGEA